MMNSCCWPASSLPRAVCAVGAGDAVDSNETKPTAARMERVIGARYIESCLPLARIHERPRFDTWRAWRSAASASDTFKSRCDFGHGNFNDVVGIGLQAEILEHPECSPRCANCAQRHLARLGQHAFFEARTDTRLDRDGLEMA